MPSPGPPPPDCIMAVTATISPKSSAPCRPTGLPGRAARNAETLLHCGYTSSIGAGAGHYIDVVLRNAINAGLIPGPRVFACGRDVVTTGDGDDFIIGDNGQIAVDETSGAAPPRAPGTTQRKSPAVASLVTYARAAASSSDSSTGLARSSLQNVSSCDSSAATSSF